MKPKVNSVHIVALIGAFFGLLFFTLLTLGVFSSSGQEAVASALEKSEFQASSFVVVLPKSMMDSADGVRFVKRFQGNPNRLYICSVSFKQFQQLSEIEGVKAEGMNVKDSPFSVLWFDGNEKVGDIFKLMTANHQKRKVHKHRNE